MKTKSQHAPAHQAPLLPIPAEDFSLLEPLSVTRTPEGEEFIVIRAPVMSSGEHLESRMNACVVFLCGCAVRRAVLPSGGQLPVLTSAQV